MLEKIKAILNEKLDIDPALVTADTNFKDDLGIDSLDLFELVTDLEEAYQIEVPAEELENLTTVGKVIDYLKGIGITA